MAEDLITYERIEHRAQARVRIYFAYRADWIERVKSIPQRKWSQTLKCWHTPDTPDALQQLKVFFRRSGSIWMELTFRYRKNCGNGHCGAEI